MAKRAKEDDVLNAIDDELFSDLKSAINKEIPNSAFILGDDEAPTDVKEYVSSGSYQLDTLISNKESGGGFPVGRVTEITGLEASGKSLLAIEACRDTQKKGGICIYIDTENATDLTFLVNMGLNPKRLIYVQVPTTEEVFQVIEKTVERITEKYKSKKNRPIVTVIWDSLAQTSTQAEVEGGYGDMQYASQAKVIGKGMRKIVQFLGASNVCFIILNQLKYKIGVVFGDPLQSSGGMATKYACSVRVRLTRKGKLLGPDKKAIIGYETQAEVIKNKVGPPGGKCLFDIFFNRGVSDDSKVLDFLTSKGLVQEVTSQKSLFVLETGEGIEFKNKEWLNISREHNEYIQRLVKKSLVTDLANPEFNLSEVERVEVSESELPE